MARAKRFKCPECGDYIELDDYLEVGEITSCPMCDVSLLVIDLDPPLLKIAEDGNSDGFDGDDSDDVEEERQDEPEEDEEF